MTVHIQSSWIKMLCTFFGRKILGFFFFSPFNSYHNRTFEQSGKLVLLLTLPTSVVIRAYSIVIHTYTGIVTYS